ncbi:hypothetical protein [Chromobacterium sp. Beijing]|uniref:hypothetical protein n=1 Tax=Chromobacterium sp. Beijing TaxID=2735795 RepID=UPI001F2C4798|nr:hypothetical protein [Chromobacterium sp. Beijing]
MRVNELSLQGGRNEMGGSGGGMSGGGMDDGYGYNAPAPRQEAPPAPRRQEQRPAPKQLDDMDDDIPF